jgi:hypothetical protein
VVQVKCPSSSLEALDVYCFAHVLFEMAVGVPLQNATCENALPNNLPDILSKFTSSDAYVNQSVNLIHRKLA